MDGKPAKITGIHVGGSRGIWAKLDHGQRYADWIPWQESHRVKVLVPFNPPMLPPDWRPAEGLPEDYYLDRAGIINGFNRSLA